MADERWKECKHHHHGCACREHAWEERVAELVAEVARIDEKLTISRLDGIALKCKLDIRNDVYKDNVALRDVADELLTEVDRLKAEVERLRPTHGSRKGRQ